MNLLRAIFIVIEIIIIAGIFCIIGMDIEPLPKFSLILDALITIGLVYIICDIVGWNIWKKKCDKELVEDLRKIKERI